MISKGRYKDNWVDGDFYNPRRRGIGRLDLSRQKWLRTGSADGLLVVVLENDDFEIPEFFCRLASAREIPRPVSLSKLLRVCIVQESVFLWQLVRPTGVKSHIGTCSLIGDLLPPNVVAKLRWREHAAYACVLKSSRKAKAEKFAEPSSFPTANNLNWRLKSQLLAARYLLA